MSQFTAKIIKDLCPYMSIFPLNTISAFPIKVIFLDSLLYNVFNFPPSKSTVSSLSVDLYRKDATLEAQAPVPQAKVLPNASFPY